MGLVRAEDLAALMMLPLSSRVSTAWVTRGYVRCGLLCDLQPIDDIDVVVDMNLDQFEKTIVPLSYRRTMHGGCSIEMKGARKVDVWPLANTFGVNCLSIEQALALYEFSCDSVAVDVVSGAVIFSAGAEDLLNRRMFDFQDPYLSRYDGGEFSLTKAIYLLVRHSLEPGEILMSFLQKSQALSREAKRLAAHFGGELIELGRQGQLARVADRFPAQAARIQAMLPGQLTP